MKLRTVLALSVINCLTILSGCSKSSDPIEEENDGEMITTIKLKFVNKANASDQLIANWRDEDGQGGNPPVIDSVILKPNTQYTMTIDAILNESVSPASDIKPEIVQEAEHHLFVFEAAGTGMNIQITDKDKNGFPVGFNSDLSTTTTANGSLRVILRHQVNTKDGSPGSGSSDIDCSFPVSVR